MTEEEQIRFALVISEAAQVRERIRADRAACADLDETEMDTAWRAEGTVSISMDLAA